MHNIKKFILSEKGIILIIFAFMLVGLLIRITLIGKTDLWDDEAFTGVVLREDWQSMFSILIEDKVHPPIYYVLLKLWCMVFGYSDIPLRAFSMFFGILLIPSTYFFGKLLSDNASKSKMIGLVAAFFASFSPYFFMYSVEARSYSMLMFWGSICGILFLNALKRSPNKFSKWWLATIIMVLSSVLVHYFSIVHIILFTVIYIFYRLLYKGTLYKRGFWYKLLFGSLISYSLVLIFFSTDFASRLVAQLQSRMGWIDEGSMLNPIKSIYAFLFGVDRQALGVPPLLDLSIPVQPVNIAIILFIIIVLCSTLYIIRNRENNLETFRISYLLIFSIGALFLVSLSSDVQVNLYVDRYLSIYGWYLIVLLSFLIVNMFGKQALTFFVIYIFLIFCVKLPPEDHTYYNTNKYIQSVSPEHVYTCTSYTMIILSNYYPDYTSKLFLYAPNSYDVLSKSKLLATAGVVKDFNNAIDGDLYICTERRDDANRTLIAEIDDMMIYRLNK